MSSDHQTHQDALDFIHEYNACFYTRDLKRLEGMYASAKFIGFWDNHKDCDSTTLEDHLEKVAGFFKNGKQTESGAIEELMVENERVCAVGDTLLVTALLRYASAPSPGVRSTYSLIKEAGRWKAIHIHHSFDPNEQH